LVNASAAIRYAATSTGDGSRQRLGRPNDHLDWAVSTALLSQCPDQPELVESGWPEPIRELAYALDGLPQLIGELDRQRFGPFWSVLGGKGDAVGFEGCAGEERAEAVVQLAAQPGPFLFGGVDDAFAGNFQVLGERLRVQHDRQRGGQEIYYVLVGSGESTFALAWADD
jgi:hypothetical protein